MPALSSQSPLDDLDAFLQATHFNKGQATQGEGEEDSWNPSPIPSSFSFKSANEDHLMFYGGTVKWSGRTSFTFADGAFVDPTYSGAYVQVAGGTSESPHAVQIRVNAAVGPSSAVMICGIEQDDGGGYFYKTIGLAYLVEGLAKFKKDRRADWQVIGI